MHYPLALELAPEDLLSSGNSNPWNLIKDEVSGVVMPLS